MVIRPVLGYQLNEIIDIEDNYESMLYAKDTKEYGRVALNNEKYLKEIYSQLEPYQGFVKDCSIKLAQWILRKCDYPIVTVAIRRRVKIANGDYQDLSTIRSGLLRSVIQDVEKKIAINENWDSNNDYQFLAEIFVGVKK